VLLLLLPALTQRKNYQLQGWTLSTPAEHRVLPRELRMQMFPACLVLVSGLTKVVL